MGQADSIPPTTAPKQIQAEQRYKPTDIPSSLDTLPSSTNVNISADALDENVEYGATDSINSTMPIIGYIYTVKLL